MQGNKVAISLPQVHVASYCNSPIAAFLIAAFFIVILKMLLCEKIKDDIKTLCVQQAPTYLYRLI